ncbi:hypothetical protein BS50DRAFT_580705 [Corynespora cassiicola Philippines]|uniref:Uncharacterized protein n=1 Tax=Corynespora cassiicola Philippines TaxID=1448308 RepID=A0A2T2P847_CORCC|nr:hypothetical protein BS50DRAFT_580705 [Corynespora cassiicola Philippines]
MAVPDEVAFWRLLSITSALVRAELSRAEPNLRRLAVLSCTLDAHAAYDPSAELTDEHALQNQQQQRQQRQQDALMVHHPDYYYHSAYPTDDSDDESTDSDEEVEDGATSSEDESEAEEERGPTVPSPVPEVGEALSEQLQNRWIEAYQAYSSAKTLDQVEDHGSSSDEDCEDDSSDENRDSALHILHSYRGTAVSNKTSASVLVPSLHGDYFLQEERATKRQRGVTRRRAKKWRLD